MLLNSRRRFDDILSLSSNDRICSFHWMRGSKHCFLTSFSNLDRYFLFLVFRTIATYMFLHAFLGKQESDSSSHFLYL
jgi:hypothetical protein